jgi:hypothetical protein
MVLDGSVPQEAGRKQHRRSIVHGRSISRSAHNRPFSIHANFDLSLKLVERSRCAAEEKETIEASH